MMIDEFGFMEGSSWSGESTSASSSMCPRFWIRHTVECNPRCRFTCFQNVIIMLYRFIIDFHLLHISSFPTFSIFFGWDFYVNTCNYPMFMSSYRHTVFGDLKLANRSGRSPFSVQDTPWGETKQPFLFPATWRLKKTCGKIEWTLPQPCLQT